MIENEEIHAEEASSACGASAFDTPKKRGIALLVAAACVLAGIYLVKLLHFLDKPLFSKVYYGTMTDVMYSICVVALWAALLVVLAWWMRKYLGLRLFRRRAESISVKRVLLIFGIAALTVFVVSCCLNFKLLISYELGEKVSGAYLSVQIAVYVRNAVQLLLAVTFMSLAQRGMEALIPCSKPLPWGGGMLWITYGLIEYFTAGQIFPWVYLLFTAVFGAIFYISENRLHTTYWASLVILIL